MKAVLDSQSIEIEDSLTNILLYGFGVYSSFVVSEKNMVRGWSYHIERIQRDAKQFLGLDVTRDDIVENVSEYLVDQNASAEMTCRVTIYPGDFNLGAPQNAKAPRILVTGRSGSSLSGQPLKLSLSECDRPYAAHKITNIGAAMKARALAKASGFDDALFTAGGIISEGPTWNVFFSRGGKVYTPANDGKILPGVTRKIVLEILGNAAEEASLVCGDLKNFDSAFATNAAIGVVPIKSIDGFEFDQENKLIASIQDKYCSFPKEEIV